MNAILKKNKKSRLRDLNPRPADYESAAIPLSHNGANLRFRRIDFECLNPYLMEWHEVDTNFYNFDLNKKLISLKNSNIIDLNFH